MVTQLIRGGGLMRESALGIITGAFLLALHIGIAAQERISPTDAAKYVGKNAIVCGQVASSNFASRSRRRPTFLNLDRPYPNHVFTALIWGENRKKFSSPPETTFSGKRICVTGTVSSYRRQPQIIVAEPSQITAE